MLKIRDLGIRVMTRPPEIGFGGGFHMAACEYSKECNCSAKGDDCSDVTNEDCNCTASKGICGPSECPDNSYKDDKRKTAGFDAAAVVQLKQQLRDRLSRDLAY